MKKNRKNNTNIKDDNTNIKADNTNIKADQKVVIKKSAKVIGGIVVLGLVSFGISKLFGGNVETVTETLTETLTETETETLTENVADIMGSIFR